MNRRRGHRFLEGAALMAAAALGCSPADPVERQASAASTEEIRRAEVITESLAGDLAEIAVALERGDRGGFARLLAPELAATPFPRAPGEPAAEHPGIARRAWPVDGAGRRLARAELAASLDRLLDRFDPLTGVDLEVVGSRVDAAGGLQADLTLGIRGRNRAGRREWLRGRAETAASRDPGGRWRLDRLVLSGFESLTADRDLFCDATEAAGLGATDPPFAVSITDGSAWYPNGAAAADADRDGLVDLFVTGPSGNRLYLNRGDGTFHDGAEKAGLATLVPAKPELVPLFFDYDDDGDLDLFVTSEYQNLLLENRLVPDGALRYRDVSAGLPQAHEVQGWSVAAGDVDRDGRTDLYVTSYFTPMKGPYPLTTVDDVDGSPNVLYLNQGGGRFREAAGEWGADDRRFGMAAQLADVDLDFDLDLYVANDFGGGNPLYINHGDRFADLAPERGAAVNAESMGASFADYDNDGDLDLHVTGMSSVTASRILARFADGQLARRELLARQWAGNVLLENRGDGSFRDVSAEAGPFPADWAWGGGFLDVDNDGWEDLHTPNGFNSNRSPRDARGLIFGGVILGMQLDEPAARQEVIDAGFIEMQERIESQGLSFAGWTRDRLYLNRGDGRYLDVSGVAGADSYPSDARASVYADFDNDGDLDVFVRATHGRAHFLFVNRVGQGAPSLTVALEGRASGRDAFGAVVRVATPALTLTKAKLGGNGYLAQSDPRLVFGLGGAARAEWIEVRWPSGLVQRLDGPFEPGALRITEGEPAPATVARRPVRLGGEDCAEPGEGR